MRKNIRNNPHTTNRSEINRIKAWQTCDYKLKLRLESFGEAWVWATAGAVVAAFFCVPDIRTVEHYH